MRMSKTRNLLDLIFIFNAIKRWEICFGAVTMHQLVNSGLADGFFDRLFLAQQMTMPQRTQTTTPRIPHWSTPGNQQPMWTWAK